MISITTATTTTTPTTTTTTTTPYLLLPNYYYFLLTTDYLLLATCYLLTTYYLLLTTFCCLLTTYCLLLITYYLRLSFRAPHPRRIGPPAESTRSPTGYSIYGIAHVGLVRFCPGRCRWGQRFCVRSLSLAFIGNACLLQVQCVG